MCTRHRLLVTASRPIRFLLNSNQCNQHAINTNLLSACRYATMPVNHWPNYVIGANTNNALINKWVSRMYATDANQLTIPIVTYEDVKDLPKHPEKWLIDVREPNELKETGVIPTAINIPRRNCFFSVFKQQIVTSIQKFCYLSNLVGEVNAAFSMKSAQFEAKYNRAKPNSNDEVIFHCKIGRRSENAAIIASKLGYAK